VLPRVVVERVLPQLHNHFGLPPEKTDFWQPITKLPADIRPRIANA